MQVDVQAVLRALVVVLLGIYVLGAPVAAQDATDRYTLVLRGVSVEQALDEVVRASRISLVYDPALIPERQIFCSAEEAPVESFLRCITRQAGIDFYTLSSGTYVLRERVQTAPRHGTLSGQIVDAHTGEPLPYASITLADGTIGTAANERGLFTLAPLVTGGYRLTASFVGYEPVVDSVYIPPSGRVSRRIALRPVTFQTSPVVIDGLQLRAPSMVLGVEEIPASDMQTLSVMGTPDVIASVARQVLGVTRSRATADLHIQGGEAGDHQFRLDGVPIFFPVSLGRMLGAFSPLAIGRLTVHKAGFTGAHGSFTSGVIEAEHALARPDAEDEPRLGVRAIAQTDPYSVNARLDVPLRLGTREGSLMLAGRKSLWDLYREPTLQGTLSRWNDLDPILSGFLLGDTFRTDFDPQRQSADLDYADLHAAVRLPLGALQSLNASFYVGGSAIATDLFARTAPVSTSPTYHALLARDRYDWTNTGAQVRFEALLGARTFYALQARASLHDLHHGYQIGTRTSTDPDALDSLEAALTTELDTGAFPQDANRIGEVGLSATVLHSLAAHHHLSAGLEILRYDHAFTLRGGNGLGVAPILFDATGVRVEGYVEDEANLNRHTTLTSSLRLTYVPDRATVYAEPRLALRYDVPRTPVGALAARGAVGVYRQFLSQFDLSNLGPSAFVPYVRFWLPVGADLPPPRAYHFTGDLLLQPFTDWSVTFESYVKLQPLILALNYNRLQSDLEAGRSTAPVTAPDFIERTSGYAYGLGVKVAHESARGKVQVSYTFSEARRRYPDRFDGDLQPTAWNEPHRFFITGDYALTPSILARARWESIWGRHWGFRQAYYDYLSTDTYGTYPLDNPGSDVIPAYAQLDLGIAYEYRLAAVRLQVGLDILNVLNRGNLLDWSLRPEPTRPTATTYALQAREMPGFTPVVSVRLAY